MTTMARRATTNYRFLTNDRSIIASSTNTELEFDESEVWGGSTRPDSPESRRPSSRRPLMTRREKMSSGGGGGGEPRSLPVNIPDWSKILRDEYKLVRREKIGFNNGGDDVSDDECYGSFDGGDERKMTPLPPHEYLARTRMASLSVHEGIGRTLKGRDLSKVRNAIWEKTGFQD